MRAWVIAMIVGLAASANADPFTPPSSVAEAQTHYSRAKQLFDDKAFSAAAEEFASAFALDPSAKFLLFDRALALRMAGACKDALAAYEEFLAAGPPVPLADNARVGIEHCRETLGEPVTPPAEPAAAAPVATVIEPATSRSPAAVVSERPWYRDGIGAVLVGSGATVTVAAGVAYVLARSAASDTFTAPSIGTYRDRRSTAETDQVIAAVGAGVGGALVVAGVLRYVLRTPPANPTVGLVPSPHGAIVGLELAF